MDINSRIERQLLVFAVWCVCGFAGIATLLEGFARDVYTISLVGSAFIVAGFIGHISINAVFKMGVTYGETALGIGLFGIVVTTFVAGWIAGGYTDSDVWSGLTLIVIIAVGLPSYLSTRYGMRGAFSQFHKAHHSNEDLDG
jgi:predicted small integral membrane protein